MAKMNVKTAKENIIAALKHDFGRTVANATPDQVYKSVGM